MLRTLAFSNIHKTQFGMFFGVMLQEKWRAEQSHPFIARIAGDHGFAAIGQIFDIRICALDPAQKHMRQSFQIGWDVVFGL